VIVFTDPSRTTLRNQTDRELSQLERNSFMVRVYLSIISIAPIPSHLAHSHSCSHYQASNLSKQNRSLMDPSDRKGKRRKQEDDEEA
jgi:putative component of membrane protein insertase Oxa1/YidC/SpoIIIJ protein YidD